MPAVATLLRDERGMVVAEAARALAMFGRRAEAAGPGLVAALTAALIAADHELADTLAAAVVAVAPDPRALVREQVGDEDPDLRRLALGTLKSQGPARGGEGRGRKGELPGLDSNQDKENQNPFLGFRHYPPMSAMPCFLEVCKRRCPLPSAIIRPIGYSLATTHHDFRRCSRGPQPLVASHRKRTG